jgi:Ca2+-dependent lipid-binding protein
MSAAANVATSASIRGVLRVTLHSGRDILSVDRNGKADPFCCVRFPSGGMPASPKHFLLLS